LTREVGGSSPTDQRRPEKEVMRMKKICAVVAVVAALAVPVVVADSANAACKYYQCVRPR
jgi:hypothetical protein